jgi:hypothetical protein
LANTSQAVNFKKSVDVYRRSVGEPILEVAPLHRIFMAKEDFGWNIYGGFLSSTALLPLWAFQNLFEMFYFSTKNKKDE